MDKDSIIHFVGFITRLHADDFVGQWKRYAKEFSQDESDHLSMLQEQTSGKGKYKYISQHEFQEEDFRFTFMKDRDTHNFPDQGAKVVMLGGYAPVLISQENQYKKAEVKVLMFFTGNLISSQFYYNMLQNMRPNIYEAFYENCVYSNIIEFTTSADDALKLKDWLVQKCEGADISIYSLSKTASLIS